MCLSWVRGAHLQLSVPAKAPFFTRGRRDPEGVCYDLFTGRGVVSINMILYLLPNASDVNGIIL